MKTNRSHITLSTAKYNVSSTYQTRIEYVSVPYQTRIDPVSSTYRLRINHVSSFVLPSFYLRLTIRERYENDTRMIQE